MLKKGDKAPEFTLESSQGHTLSLSDFKGRWVILYYYPKDNTPGCTRQANDFTELYSEFKDLGVEILGINADSIKTHQTFCSKQSIPYPLLSDSEKIVLSAYKVWGEKTFMGKIYEGLTRSTFLINPEGNIAEAMYNIKVAGHGARVLKIVKTHLGL